MGAAWVTARPWSGPPKEASEALPRAKKRRRPLIQPRRRVADIVDPEGVAHVRQNKPRIAVPVGDTDRARDGASGCRAEAEGCQLGDYISEWDAASIGYGYRIIRTFLIFSRELDCAILG